MAMQEAKEQMGQTLRWTEQPKNAEDKSIYMGPTVQGFYNGIKTNVGQNASNIYELKLRDGSLVGFWGSGLLDGKFKDIPMGCEVRVSFLGVRQPKTSKGRPYQDFKVEYDPSSRAPMVEAGPVQPSVAQAPTLEQEHAANQAVAGSVFGTAGGGQGF